MDQNTAKQIFLTRKVFYRSWMLYCHFNLILSISTKPFTEGEKGKKREKEREWRKKATILQLETTHQNLAESNEILIHMINCSIFCCCIFNNNIIFRSKLTFLMTFSWETYIKKRIRWAALVGGQLVGIWVPMPNRYDKVAQT